MIECYMKLIGLLSEQKIELPDHHTTEKCRENMKKDVGANLVAGRSFCLIHSNHWWWLQSKARRNLTCTPTGIRHSDSPKNVENCRIKESLFDFASLATCFAPKNLVSQNISRKVL